MGDLTFLVLGIIILIAFVGNILFRRTKVPEIFFLIVLGIVIGPVTGIVDQAAIIAYAPVMVALMLIVIMLDNGLSFNVFKVARALPMSIAFSLGILALNTVAFSVILYYGLGLSWIASAIVALCMAGTTTDVITVLISRMHIAKKSKQLLVLDSVMNDFQIIPFFILLHFAQTASVSTSAALWSFMLLPLAVVIGGGVAMVWLYVIGNYLGRHPLNYIATLGILFALYNIMQLLGGNGAIAILTFSLILGNAMSLFRHFNIPYKRRRKFTPKILSAFRAIQTDISFFVRIIFFVFLGIVFSFKILTFDQIVISVVILAAALLCRYAVVKILVRRHPSYSVATGPLVWICPRGYVAAVLAFAVASSGLFDGVVVNIVLLNIFLTTFVSIIYSIYYEKKVLQRI